MKNPLVSVIISTFNNEKTLEKCLESIHKQTYTPVEIIIVDEWSKDKTQEIAKKNGAKVYLHGKERANNRNYGIGKSQGDYYFFLDSDMELEKDVIQQCVALCENKQADAIVITEKSIGIGYWAKVRGFERIYNKGNNYVEAARFFKKSVIERIGGYDPSIVGAEDWDLQQRILTHGFVVDRISAYIIHHEGNINLNKLLRKKMYYGKAFLLYKNRYPEAFKKSVIRTQLFKHWFTFLKHPKYGVGVFVLKLLEGLALFSGMLMAKLGYEPPHY